MQREDYLDDMILDVEASNEADEFTIDNDDVAEWAVRKIKATMDDAQRRADLCDREIARYTAEKARILKNAEDSTIFLRAHLKGYFEAQSAHHQTTKAGTRMYRLITGKLVLKQQAPEIDRDDEAVMDWAGAVDGSLVKTERRLAWSELKKRSHVENGALVYDETGEIIPGVTVTPRAPEFKVEV